MDLGSSFTLVRSITPARPWSNKDENRPTLSENKLSLKSKKNKNINCNFEEDKVTTLEKYFTIKKLILKQTNNKENTPSCPHLMNFVNEDTKKDRGVLSVKNIPVSVDNKGNKKLECNEYSKESVNVSIKSVDSNIYDRSSCGSSKDIFASFVESRKSYSISEVKQTSACEIKKTYKCSVSSVDIKSNSEKNLSVPNDKCSPKIRRSVKRRSSRRSSSPGDENNEEPLLRTTRGRGAKTTIADSSASSDSIVVESPTTDIPIRPIHKNSIEITESGITRLSTDSSRKAPPSSKTFECGEKPRKKLKSCFEKELSLTEKFDIKSSIKTIQHSTNRFISNSEGKALVLKEVNKSENSKILGSSENKGKAKKLFSDKKKSNVNKSVSDKKEIINEENVEKLNESSATNKLYKRKSCDFERRSSLSSVCPSTLTVNKFEEINNWLSDTHDKTIIISDSDSEVPKTPSLTKKSRKSNTNVNVSTPVTVQVEGGKKQTHSDPSRKERSLSLNISSKDKNKQNVEIINISSDDGTPSKDPVSLSENLLNKLYGAEWGDKDEVLPQSEPKRRPTKDTIIRKHPRTEIRKRTSVYDVFSPSSEDSFEEFLDNVRHGKFESTRHPGKRLDADDFINDSSSDEEPSFTLYRKFVVDDIREDVKSLTPQNRNCAFNSIRPPKHRLGRRLSFSSLNSDGQASEHSAFSGSKPQTENKKETKEIDKIKVSRKKKNVSEVESKVINSTNSKDSVKKSNDNVPGVNKIKSTDKKYQDVPRTPKVTTGKLQTPATKKTPAPNTCVLPKLSFLSSLSEMTGGLPCHPDAVKYKKSYKKLREELAFKLFDLYNKEVFENKLPSDMLIQWNGRMTSTSGFCYNKREFREKGVLHSSRIVLSSKILDRPDRLRDTLIHELCHAATWIVDKTSDGHGPMWKAWADKANHKFPELPRIKRCHNYAITTKFTYKCLTCGYSIGRHSKSLDVERKRCGYCLGKFELLVTAKQGGGASSVTSGSDSMKSARKPNGFALFVKENYSTVKKANSKISHSEVMKVLAQKFAQVKISKQCGSTGEKM